MSTFYVLGFVFCVCLGSLGHFLYELFNHNKIAAIFFAVNESTWEHIKIGLTPLFIFAIVEYFLYGQSVNFWFNKMLSLFTFVFLIPTMFYSYKLLTKKHFLILDIIIFVLSLFVSLLLNYYLNNITFNFSYDVIGIIGILILLTMYFSFTYFPLKNFIFLDPITKRFGIEGHSH